MGGIDMKIKNLMIGDWVMANNVPCKIWPINEHGVFSEKGTSYYSMEEIKAIPITPEILEKNGWYLKPAMKGDSDSCWLYKNDKITLSLSFPSERSVGVLGMFTEHAIRTMPGFLWQDTLYVHELQHALRLCGLEELADNFEV